MSEASGGRSPGRVATLGTGVGASVGVGVGAGLGLAVGVELGDGLGGGDAAGEAVADAFHRSRYRRFSAARSAVGRRTHVVRLASGMDALSRYGNGIAAWAGTLVPAR